jgi:hypothetical protein
MAASPVAEAGCVADAGVGSHQLDLVELGASPFFFEGCFGDAAT